MSVANHPPIASDDEVTTGESHVITFDVLTNDTDAECNTLSVTSFSNGTKGSVSCTTAGVCTYTPCLNLNGTDSYTYTVSDGSSSSTGTVSVTVAAVNDPPVATPPRRSLDPTSATRRTSAG